MVHKSTLPGRIRKQRRRTRAIAIEVDTETVAWVFRPWVERRGMVCKSLMEEAKKLCERKRRLGNLCQFFCHCLKILKGTRNLGTFGIVEIHIGQQMNPGLKLLYMDGMLNWMCDVGFLVIDQEEVEGIIALGGLVPNGHGSLAGGRRLEGVEA